MKILNKFLIALFVVGFTTSCSDDFFDVDASQNSPVSSTPDLSLPVAQKYSVDVLQGDYNSMNTLGNLWSYTWAAGGDFVYFTDETAYLITSSFRTGIFQNSYIRPLRNYNVVEKNTDPKYSNYVAIAKIMKAFHYQYLVDAYGNIPYSEALQGSANVTPAYDDANAIYDDLIVQLTAAQDLIANADGTVLIPGANNDIMMQGNMAKWAKFANTLKLRILLRQSEKAGLVAQADFDAAVDNGIGFLGAGEDVLANPGYVNDANKQNPFYGAFGKTVAGDPAANANATRATDYAISKLAIDPRRPFIYKNVGANPANFVGIQQNAVGGTVSAGLSGIGPGVLKGATQDGVIMLAAESLLLQAEAASKGYIIGDAGALYNAGVQASFTYLGAGSATAYLVDFPYPASSAFNLSAIIYQKWVALNGINGFESWIEYRRTGFPADLPVAPNQTASTVIPVRLLYPATEYSANPNNVPTQTSTEAFTSKVFWQN